MKAYESLLENFSSMQEEFSSSNNRIMRNIDETFNSGFMDLLASLEYFNEEYMVLEPSKINGVVETLKKQIEGAKVIHVSKYQSKFDREVNALKQQMYNFFKAKLIKGDSTKRKMSGDIKDILDKICDFNVISLEEDIDDLIYNFKVNFEMSYINNEYCKDDFNKIIRTFKHSLVGDVRNILVNSIAEKQDIVSRYASKSYEIIEHYRELNRIVR